MPRKMPETEARLIVRELQPADFPAIVAMSDRVYGAGYTADNLRGQLSHFREGQFVAEYDGRVVGHCATFRIDEAVVTSPHTWREITGGGFGSRHDSDGNWLYGMEVCVDPDFRGMRIGRRLYDRRKRLCQELDLRGIVFGGRLPGLARKLKQFGSVEEYVEAVAAERSRDAVLSFQLRNGFVPSGVMPGYMPSDGESLGYALRLMWRNPQRAEHAVVRRQQKAGDLPDVVRVATVQYQQRRIDDFAAFARQVEYFVDIAADYRSDFVVFPELFTLQLLSIANEPLSPADSLRTLTQYTDEFRELLKRLAVAYNINIIGGSHPTFVEDGDIHNVCYVALRDGSMHTQEKLHPTPNERHWWKISGGEQAAAILTDCGPIGVMICYDAEFPELARHLTDQGALMLFVPFCTDVRQGYLRVRYCSQARAVENQCYVITSGNVGNLPGVNNFDIQYSQSGIFTPCDFPFPPDGVAAMTTENAEAVAFADLRLDALLESRASGTVQNLKDRRHDLYQTAWPGAHAALVPAASLRKPGPRATAVSKAGALQEPGNSAPARKSAAKNAPAKKAAAKKSTTRKHAVSKPAAKQSTAKQSTAKQPAAKKSAAKKSAAKKSVAKASPAKRSTKGGPANNAAARRATAKKAARKKVAAKTS